MEQLSLGILSRSRKPDERRLPIHPDHFQRIDADLRARIYIESGYGEQFGLSDDKLAPYVGGILTREQLIAKCDAILLPKPQKEDLAELREGQILWGWPHCVQDTELTQVAIDRKLTLVAFEAMNYWTADGGFSLHVFHKNNELAGYCSVLHAMQTVGVTGDYGRRLRAAVIGFGATARGAVTVLAAHGVTDVDVLTERGVNAVASPIHSAQIVQFEHDQAAPRRSEAILRDGSRQALPAFLGDHDIIVNCVLQKPEAPLMFLDAEDLVDVAPGTLIVDVSCDEGMGFSWARPTTFAEPTFTVGDHVTYYGVDHSPSLLWASATWEISDALLPYLRTVLDGRRAREADETIRRAIEIKDGVIINPSILDFQSRAAAYPHAKV
ncbi:alanine dehydrogenase [Antricoccus suffuscus]|uniref:Alanine dehydrogenase n=1 Tax=Antricoccus suffuscus TaxID=1629062 RepID=A0A2T1A2R8_9ACTN|nr:N(5)-(carboxyethyl)ornithine synthase [Antricoccus suffuscus]PRZ42883.1 alanine dehydrogenase [Antricoccus suffuscus]